MCEHIDRLAKPSRFEQKICGETVSYSQGTSLQADSTMKECILRIPLRTFVQRGRRYKKGSRSL